MNASLGYQNRRKDILGALEQIASYLEEREVDVMLVTGDVFEKSGAEKKGEAVEDFKRIFTPFLGRGGTILMISGNHDDEIFFNMLRDALDLNFPNRKGLGGTHPTGRLYVAANARMLRLIDATGTTVQFVMMPYPTPRCYLYGENVHYESIEQKHRDMQQRFVNTLQSFEAKLDKKIPTVLLSHVHVRGVRAHNLYKINEGDDIIFEQGDIPTHWAYAAYGHIHRPQEAVGGAPHVRYAGSVERMNVGESDDDKSVVIFDIDPSHLTAEPELLPLKSTPIYHVEITDPDNEIPQLTSLYPDASTSLISYNLHWQPAKHNPDQLCRAIKDIFKRCYQHELFEVGRDESRINFTPQKLADVPGTVRDYLALQLEEHPQRADLLALAEEFLAMEVWL
jgi:exonuclease SbcD